jgi:dTMP kinase
LARAHHRNERTQDVETRLDEQSLEFYRKVRAAYHQLAEDEPKRVKLIDGSREAGEVADAVWSAVQLLLAK